MIDGYIDTYVLISVKYFDAETRFILVSTMVTDAPMTYQPWY